MLQFSAQLFEEQLDYLRFFFLFFKMAVLGIEPRTSSMLSICSATKLCSPHYLIFLVFEQETLHFHFAQGSASYVRGPASQGYCQIAKSKAQSSHLSLDGLANVSTTYPEISHLACPRATQVCCTPVSKRGFCFSVSVIVWKENGLLKVISLRTEAIHTHRASVHLH